MTTDKHNASDRELEAIAFLVEQTRPGWAASLVLSVLQGHRDQVNAPDLAIAALRAAQTPDFRTPKTIGWRGPHWQGLASAPEEVRRLARCGVCGKTEDKCETQRLGLDDDHDFEPVQAVRFEKAR